MTVHCWEDWQDEDTMQSYTCLLESGHDGEHEWTPDGEIIVEFEK